MLILITIKNRLTYEGIQLTLKFLGSFSEKTAALSPLPSLLNPLLSTSPLLSEVK